MTRPLFETTQQRQIASNRYMTKDTRQRPYAGRWIYPLDDADCGLAAYTVHPLGASYGFVEDWTPCLLNGWAHINPNGAANLEAFGFRMHHDGSLELQGHLDGAGASSGTVAMILPGVDNNEPSYVDLLNKNQNFDTVITDDGGTSFQIALVLIDADTGEITITWPAA